MYSQNEIWKEITLYPKYKVSNFGNVFSLKYNKLLLPFERKGYLSVHLCNKTDVKRYKNKTIHSLVALSFLGERKDKQVINHINGNKHDNNVSNLEYCTQSYNRKEDFKMGRQSFLGEKNNMSKLKTNDVLNIVNLYKTGEYTYRSLAKKLNVSYGCIGNILMGNRWNHITKIK